MSITQAIDNKIHNTSNVRITYNGISVAILKHSITKRITQPIQRKRSRHEVDTGHSAMDNLFADTTPSIHSITNTNGTTHFNSTDYIDELRAEIEADNNGQINDMQHNNDVVARSSTVPINDNTIYNIGDEQLLCCICGTDDGTEIYQCHICHTTIHKECYFIDVVNPTYIKHSFKNNIFTCQPCYTNQYKQRTDIPYCDLCGTYDDKALLLIEDQWLHAHCTELIPTVHDGCKQCTYCKIDIGICVSCDYTAKCQHYIHIPCAIRQKAYDTVRIGNTELNLFYCHIHGIRTDRLNVGTRTRMLQMKHSVMQKYQLCRSVANTRQFPISALNDTEYCTPISVPGICRHDCCKLTNLEYNKELTDLKVHESLLSLHCMCDASCHGYKLLNKPTNTILQANAMDTAPKLVTVSDIEYITVTDKVIPKRVDTTTVQFQCRHTCKCNNAYTVLYNNEDQVIVTSNAADLPVNTEIFRSCIANNLLHHKSNKQHHTDCNNKCVAHKLLAAPIPTINTVHSTTLIKTPAANNNNTFTTSTTDNQAEYVAPNTPLNPIRIENNIEYYQCRHSNWCCGHSNNPTQTQHFTKTYNRTKPIDHINNYHVSNIRQKVQRHERSLLKHRHCNQQCTGHKLLDLSHLTPNSKNAAVQSTPMRTANNAVTTPITFKTEPNTVNPQTSNQRSSLHYHNPSNNMETPQHKHHISTDISIPYTHINKLDPIKSSLLINNLEHYKCRHTCCKCNFTKIRNNLSQARQGQLSYVKEHLGKHESSLKLHKHCNIDCIAYYILGTHRNHVLQQNKSTVKKRVKHMRRDSDTEDDVIDSHDVIVEYEPTDEIMSSDSDISVKQTYNVVLDYDTSDTDTSNIDMESITQ